MSKRVCAVAVMAKASIAGTVKTRLVPPLTYDEAAQLNTCCLLDVAASILAAAASEPIQAFAAYTPLGAEAFFAGILPEGFQLLAPKEPTIGRSLVHASLDLLTAGYGSVCLVNADSPTLPTAILAEAVRCLRQPGDRVVLGPAIDGGYYLIGLKHFHGRLFEEIDWSTDRVYQQTLARAAEIGLGVAALPTWYDVDDGRTLAILARELLLGSIADRQGYSAQRTTAFLQELAAKKDGISRLLDRTPPAHISCASSGEN